MAPFNQHHPQNIVVVGAGVLGLSSALTIQSRHPSIPITIVASELPSHPAIWFDVTDNGFYSGIHSSPDRTTNGKEHKVPRPSADYASMWAGAHYRPIPRSSRQLEEESELAFRTNEIMLKFAREYDVNDCGVAVMPAIELLERPGAVEMGLKTGDAYASADDNFRILIDEELEKYETADEQRRVKWGCAYDSYCVNVHVYCRWLLDRFTSNGGGVLKRELTRLEDAFDLEACASKSASASGPPLVINCSGRNFDTDPAMKFIRGQTVLVTNTYHSTITRQNSDGSWAFIIPRPGGGGTVIGGTKEIDDPTTEARPQTRQELLDNAVKYFPDFVNHVYKFEVLTDNVGRRPWREGGLRIEAEDIIAVGGRVIHAYGAGGRGYEVSWGVADKVADLVDTSLRGHVA